jgi:hypothetical protein
MVNALWLPAPSARAEKEQITLPEPAQSAVQGHRDPLLRLLAGIPPQLDPIQIIHQPREARAIQAPGRIPAPKIRPAQELPRRVLDVVGRGPPRAFPGREFLSPTDWQVTYSIVGQLNSALCSGCSRAQATLKQARPQVFSPDRACNAISARPLPAGMGRQCRQPRVRPAIGAISASRPRRWFRPRAKPISQTTCERRKPNTRANPPKFEVAISGRTRHFLSWRVGA